MLKSFKSNLIRNLFNIYQENKGDLETQFIFRQVGSRSHPALNLAYSFAITGFQPI